MIDGTLPNIFLVRLAFVVLLTFGFAAASFTFIESPISRWAQLRSARAV